MCGAGANLPQTGSYTCLTGTSLPQTGSYTWLTGTSLPQTSSYTCLTGTSLPQTSSCTWLTGTSLPQTSSCAGALRQQAGPRRSATDATLPQTLLHPLLFRINFMSSGSQPALRAARSAIISSWRRSSRTPRNRACRASFSSMTTRQLRRDSDSADTNRSTSSEQWAATAVELGGGTATATSASTGGGDARARNCGIGELVLLCDRFRAVLNPSPASPRFVLPWRRRSGMHKPNLFSFKIARAFSKPAPLKEGRQLQHPSVPHVPSRRMYAPHAHEGGGIPHT